jgi:hypothetical protein
MRAKTEKSDCRYTTGLFQTRGVILLPSTPSKIHHA